MSLTSQIIAVGSYLPQKILTNSDLEKLVETTEEWIVERTGIKQRHIAAENEFTSDLAFQASRRALKNSGLSVNEIELIIVATTTPDLTFPSTASILQKKLSASKAFAFDIQAVCSGFVYALTTAHSYILSGLVKNALVVGAETLSRIVDWNDRNTCILFGDGAGAVVLQATKKENSGILGCSLHSDGSLCDILKTSGGVSTTKSAGIIEMEGREVFKHAIEKMSSSVLSTLSKANLTCDQIDWLVPHQANLRIISAVATKLKLPIQKVILTVENHGNTSAASIPLALDYAVSKNLFKKGDLIILEALGGGLTWGSVALCWN
jgi:3-oxoacyl-[acyl-carrier-protein] synthase-3